MMRTEDDLRAACEHLEQDAPALDDVLAALAGPEPRRHSPRRTYLAVGGTVAAVAAVAAVTVAVVGLAMPGRHRAPNPPPARPGPGGSLSQVDFAVIAPPRYVVVGYDSGQLFQRVSLATPGSGLMATVTLYRRGGYDGATSGTPVVVNGRPGVILADAHPASVSYRATDPSQHTRAVLWQYTPGAWAMATRGTGATNAAVDQANLRLAQAIQLGSTPVRVPFKLSYLPAGLTGESAETWHDTVHTADRSGDLSLGDGTPARSPLADSPWGSAMDIVAWSDHVAFTDEYACPRHPRRFTVGPDTGCFLTDHGATSGLLIDRQGHTVRMLIEPSHYGKYSDAELVRILAGLTFAPDITDEATWFPAGSALP
jgi:hypothetical protein